MFNAHSSFESRYSAFSNAVGNGHLAVAQWLAKNIPEPLRKGMFQANDYQEFLFAVHNGDLAMVQWFFKALPPSLKKGLFKVWSPNDWEIGGLGIAVKNGHLEIIQ